MAEQLKVIVPLETGDVEVTEDDLSFSILNHITGWFGELGRGFRLLINVYDGDPDSVASLVWIARRINGITPNPEPKQIGDVAIGKFLAPNRNTPGAGLKTFPLHLPPEYTETVEFDLDSMLTTGALRKIRQWFPILSSFTVFFGALKEWDGQATSAALWLAIEEANKTRQAEGRELLPVWNAVEPVEDFSVRKVLKDMPNFNEWVTENPTDPPAMEGTSPSTSDGSSTDTLENSGSAGPGE